MPQPTDLLSCPPSAITLSAPMDGVRFATDGEQSVVGVLSDGELCWADTVVPAPLSLIDSLESVAYHQMWSGVLEVELPRADPLRIWLCDGELQVLLLTIDAQGSPQLMLS
ncbi:MAG: hypothetical protein P8R54_31290 [Myxococcota bacterium]|nr:hypothetical protein [Myxococcota bacterium]